MGRKSMTRIGKLIRAVTAFLALFLIATSAEAQIDPQQLQPAPKLRAFAKASVPKASVPRASKATKPHRLILQVNSNDAAMMNLTLNNATNVIQYYKDLGEKVSVEIVTFGPGLH